MLVIRCSAYVPMPGGRFGPCGAEPFETYRCRPLCPKHLAEAKRAEARQHPGYLVFQRIMANG